jgi:hypothetical protein
MRDVYKYLRKEIWWVGYLDLDGASNQRSTGCRVHQGAKAEKLDRGAQLGASSFRGARG